MIAYFKEIDAETASHLLTRNKLNRRLDPARVSRYVSDMKNGYWCMNGDAIRFDEEGNLADGQHRLVAVVKSDTKQTFIIIENVHNESKRTIDTGKSRTGSDVLSMFANVGVRDSGVISSAICKLICYEKGLAIGYSGASTQYLSNASIEEYFKKNSDLITTSLDFINSIIDSHALVLSRAESLFLHVIFSRIDAEKANVFMKKIITGIGVEEDTNEALLRSILTKRALKTVKVSSSDMAYTIIKAWNRNKKGGAYTTESSMRYYGSKDSGYPFAI